MKLVGLLVQGNEKRQALNMVPVIVTQQDVRVNGPVAELLSQRLAQHAHAAPAIDDEQASAVRPELDARRVPAVAKVLLLWRGGGAADSPELDAHKKALDPARRDARRNSILYQNRLPEPSRKLRRWFATGVHRLHRMCTARAKEGSPAGHLMVSRGQRGERAPRFPLATDRSLPLG